MDGQVYDLAVIGGGINGCGIARDAAGRGASVILLEADDLASGTSSASTKLIHGGLRYLEHGEFALVREALIERERLWAIAPHAIAPLGFVLPHVHGLRPFWLLRLGLFLYDHIGGRKRLPACRTIDLSRHPAGQPLKSEYRRALAYWDCRVDDARLVVLNARDAADRGARIETRCRVEGLARQGETWRIETVRGIFHARAVANATGPGVTALLGRAHEHADHAIRLVRGSHIVVPRLFDHDLAYFFQLPDSRIFFAIPYEREFTLIGTTDCEHAGGKPEASADEIAYLCEGASRYFRKPVLPGDAVWAYSGVRPLVEDGSGKPEAATRGYRLDLSDEHEGAPLLSVFGGKITTYRHLAEEAVDRLSRRLPVLERPGWTAGTPLPGGDFATDGLAGLTGRIADRYAFLEPDWAARLARSYGTLAFSILGEARSLADCRGHFGQGLTGLELAYLVNREWAQTTEDVLWRRSKLGLHLARQEVDAVENWLAGNCPDGC